MKSSDLKVVAIILAIALFFTIVTSNAVSIASVVLLATGGISSSASAPSNGGDTPATPADNGNTSTPTNGGDTPATPADNGNTDTPSNGGDTPATPADNGNTNTPADNGNTNTNTDKPADNGNTNKPADNGGSKPADSNTWDTAKCFNFYKDACNKIKSTGSAGHTRKEWQTLVELDLGSPIASNLIKPILMMFIKGEDKAGESVSEKGSDDAKNRMCPCNCDMSYVASAKKEDLANGNYKITIVMKDENTPKKDSKGIASMSTGILYMEDVQDTVKNDSTVNKIVKSLDKGELNYKAYTIVAEMTKDGKFVDINHFVTGELAAEATTSIGKVSGNGVLEFHSHWYDFKY